MRDSVCRSALQQRVPGLLILDSCKGWGDPRIARRIGPGDIWNDAYS